jgi:YHS domain-containing protein
MTVPADPSAHPLERDGVTYYFCRAGCRQEFERNAGAYLGSETEC